MSTYVGLFSVDELLMNTENIGMRSTLHSAEELPGMQNPVCTEAVREPLWDFRP